MEAEKRFNDYSTYIRNTFGERVQKISLETGFTCPNRDGDKGRGGCTYCNLDSIRPAYMKSCKDIAEQLERGMDFFRKGKRAEKFLAYFQTYTSTYQDLSLLKEACEKVLQYPGVVGIVMGTRPDCVFPELVDYLADMAKSYYVAVELGIESTDENTLRRVNRCHTFEDTQKAIQLLADRSIHIGGHLILGFPWENRETILSHAMKLAQLPLHSLKLHHLQILKHTQLAKEHQQSPFNFLDPNEYMELIIEFLELSHPGTVFQRFLTEAPSHLLIAPHWGGIKNYQFMQRVNEKMKEMGTWQGGKYSD